METIQEGVPQALPTKPETQLHTQNKRGLFLTIMLVYLAINTVQGLDKITSLFNPTYFQWFLLLPVLFSIVELFILVGLWRWKKIAVYSLILYTIVDPILGFYMVQSLVVSIGWPIYLLGVIGFFLVPFLLLLWAIQRKWYLFM